MGAISKRYFSYKSRRESPTKVFKLGLIFPANGPHYVADFMKI